MHIINLSYPLSETTPSYGDKHKISIKALEQISRGNTSNSYEVKFYNHIGTHIDCPNHFFDNGKKINEYKINDFVFNSPQIVDVDIIELNEISYKTITQKLSVDSDIILFRTFFSQYRLDKKYINNYPFFASDLAKDLKNNFPNLKAIGLDIISLTSPINKNEGKKCHQILLDDSRNNAIMIIEDMYLDLYDKKINNIIVSPIFIDKIDSSPCNVFGII